MLRVLLDVGIRDLPGLPNILLTKAARSSGIITRVPCYDLGAQASSLDLRSPDQPPPPSHRWFLATLDVLQV
jgi:hypothetical protein